MTDYQRKFRAHLYIQSFLNILRSKSLPSLLHSPTRSIVRHFSHLLRRHTYPPLPHVWRPPVTMSSGIIRSKSHTTLHTTLAPITHEHALKQYHFDSHSILVIVININLGLHSRHSLRHPACHSVIHHPLLNLNHENIDNDSIRMILNDLSLKLHSCHPLRCQSGDSVVHHQWPSPDQDHIDCESIRMILGALSLQLHSCHPLRP